MSTIDRVVGPAADAVGGWAGQQLVSVLGAPTPATAGGAGGGPPTIPLYPIGAPLGTPSTLADARAQYAERWVECLAGEAGLEQARREAGAIGWMWAGLGVLGGGVAVYVMSSQGRSA